MLSGPPYLTCPRPVFRLLERLRPGNRFTFQDVARLTDSPPSTVTRYLDRLVAANLVIKARRGEYISPSIFFRALIVSEPSPYVRSVLAWRGAEPHLGLGPVAFACLSVKGAIGIDIPQAVPVLGLPSSSGAVPDLGRFPQATRMRIEPSHLSTVPLRIPSSASEEEECFRLDVSCLRPEIALALLAATADPRILRELPAACESLGVASGLVLDRAKEMGLELPDLRVVRPNTVVPGTWLRSLMRTGRKVQAKAALDRLTKVRKDRTGRRRERA